VPQLHPVTNLHPVLDDLLIHRHTLTICFLRTLAEVLPQVGAVVGVLHPVGVVIHHHSL
jgi:hypothetical protein